MNEEEKQRTGAGSGIDRRTFVGASALVAATASVVTLATPHVAKAATKPRAERKFAFSTPFSGQDSFSGQIGGLNQAIKDHGGELTVSDASFDLKKQNDQIAALAASKPDALLILAVDPVGCSRAVDAAAKSGVPVFLMDSYVPNATAVTCGFHNNYGMGQMTMEYMAKRLNGKGKIAVMELPINEAWNMRDFGRENVLTRYPDIDVVGNWAFDPTGKTTPRSAADGFLAAHEDLDAIWCAWDNAAMEASLGILAAGKSDKVFTTGTDGGKAAFEVLKSGGPFAFTCAQSFYSQAYDLLVFAHQHLDGKPVPRMVINPVYAVDKATLDKAGDLANDYDKVGVPEQLGWIRSL
ncbi:MAG: sugar ABC transporter substrate-binding protein [Stappiaceae bacterium]